MAKIVQLKKEGVDVYPRTLGEVVLISGTTLLPEKLSEMDEEVEGKALKPLVIEIDDVDASVSTGTYSRITSALSEGREVLVKVQVTGEGVEYIPFSYDDSYEDTYVFSLFGIHAGVENEAMYVQITSSDYVQYNHYSIAQTNSPVFTGIPTAPTASADTNNTQIATTAFVQSAIGNTMSGMTPISNAEIDDIWDSIINSGE